MYMHPLIYAYENIKRLVFYNYFPRIHLVLIQVGHATLYYHVEQLCSSQLFLLLGDAIPSHPQMFRIMWPLTMLSYHWVVCEFVSPPQKIFVEFLQTNNANDPLLFLSSSVLVTILPALTG